MRIPLEKQCQTQFHYKEWHIGDTKHEGDSLLIALKEVKEDVYHEKTAMGKKIKPTSPVARGGGGGTTTPASPI